MFDCSSHLPKLWRHHPQVWMTMTLKQQQVIFCILKVTVLPPAAATWNRVCPQHHRPSPSLPSQGWPVVSPASWPPSSRYVYIKTLYTFSSSTNLHNKDIVLHMFNVKAYFKIKCILNTLYCSKIILLSLHCTKRSLKSCAATFHILHLMLYLHMSATHMHAYKDVKKETASKTAAGCK